MKPPSFVLSLFLGLPLLLGVSIGAGHAASVRTLDREEDPVIVTGDTIPGFAGVALDQLFVYAYSGGAWQQIPWQFDEVVGGQIAVLEDAQLDADDLLLVMASDTGDQAPADSWIDNVGSRQFPRYEITVSDPLNPAKKGWVYVYRSTTDFETVTADYADFDAPLWLFEADRYRLGIIPFHMSADRLEMHGSGVDVLDRTKIRVFVEGLSLRLTEDDITLVGSPMVRDGRVRAYGTYGMEDNELTLYGYRSSFEFVLDVDFAAALPSLTTLDTLRLSADLSQAAIGSTYYDANTVGGVPVNGQPDPVATLPASDWWQISGNTGTVIQIADLSVLGGTRTNYYKDDATVDSTDTGDGRSYADCGSQIEDASAHLIIDLRYYVLPANQPNIGATYRNYATQPLQSATSEQQYTPTGKHLRRHLRRQS